MSPDTLSFRALIRVGGRFARICLLWGFLQFQHSERHGNEEGHPENALDENADDERRLPRQEPGGELQGADGERENDVPVGDGLAGTVVLI